MFSRDWAPQLVKGCLSLCSSLYPTVLSIVPGTEQIFNEFKWSGRVQGKKSRGGKGHKKSQQMLPNSYDLGLWISLVSPFLTHQSDIMSPFLGMLRCPMEPQRDSTRNQGDRDFSVGGNRSEGHPGLVWPPTKSTYFRSKPCTRNPVF